MTLQEFVDKHIMIQTEYKSLENAVHKVPATFISGQHIEYSVLIEHCSKMAHYINGYIWGSYTHNGLTVEERRELIDELLSLEYEYMEKIKELKEERRLSECILTHSVEEELTHEK